VKHLVAIAIAGALLSCAGLDREETLRGRFVEDQSDWYLTPCDRDAVYWVRVLASNSHFAVYERIRELRSREPVEPIIAELKGRLDAGVPSAGPTRAVQGVFTVSQVVSLDFGTCSSSHPDESEVK